MAPPIAIKENKLLLVEGADAYYFCIWACQAFGVEGIQVVDFGGIDDLSFFLELLKTLPDYEKVRTIAIARDAEKNPSGAIASIKSSLKRAGLPVASKPFEFKGTKPRVAYLTFPGYKINSKNEITFESGTLEDLCLATIGQDVVMECVEEYLKCLGNSGHKIKHLHKFKVHAYLSGKNEFTGLKIGEAAKAGAWNWDHKKLGPFKNIIRNM